jgi:hypothetical protein
MEKYNEFAVGRGGRSGGRIINTAGVAGNFAEDFCVGHLGARGSGGILRCRRKAEEQEKKQKTDRQRDVSHVRII